MRYARTAIGAFLLLAVAVCSSATPEAVAGAEPPSARGADLSFPGGGAILFMPANGWSLGDSAFGIVTSMGAVHGYFSGRSGSPAFAYWDPADPSRILAGNLGPQDLVRFGVSGNALQRLDAWRRTPYLEAVHYSADGRYMAWRSTAHSELRIRNLSGGGVRRIHARGDLVGWLPSGQLLISARRGRYQLVDPRSAQVTPFLSKALISRELPNGWHGASMGDVSWSTDGRLFSAVVWSHHGGQVRSAIAVGTADGRIRDVVRLGRGTTYTTTWSPSSDAFAYLLSGDTSWRAGVFDVATGRRTTVATDLSSWWPPAWSPDGRWLLIDDQQHSRWVFAARDGSETRTYPELGAYPRWGGSTFASPSANVRIPHC
jgi:hypothetical protein